MQSAENFFQEWIWLTQLNFNLLLYGIGDKSSVALDFMGSYLHDEDVICINGSLDEDNLFLGDNSENVVRRLLNLIWSEILFPPGSSGSTEGLNGLKLEFSILRFLDTTLDALKKHYALSSKELFGRNAAGYNLYGNSSNSVTSRTQEARQHRLYILVLDIDGPFLSSPASQEVLSRLACCNLISLVATVDHVNSPLMWGHELLSRFRWTYHHFSTFECFDISSTFESMHCANGKASSANDAQVMSSHAGLEFLLRSLTSRHREVIHHLSLLEIMRREDSSKKPQGLEQEVGVLDSLLVTTDPVLENTYNKGECKWNSKGVFLDGLYEICRSKLIVHNLQNLNQHLRELIDHKLISIHHSKSVIAHGPGNTLDYIAVHLPTNVLQMLVTKE